MQSSHSPNTERIDAREKLLAYRLLPSLRDLYADVPELLA